MSPKESYQLAYNAHYKERDHDKAYRLYQEVVAKYPGSTEARYAKTQLENLGSATSATNKAAAREQARGQPPDSIAQTTDRSPPATSVYMLPAWMGIVPATIAPVVGGAIAAKLPFVVGIVLLLRLIRRSTRRVYRDGVWYPYRHG